MRQFRKLRDRALVRLMTAGGSRRREVEIHGLRVSVEAGVCNPAPFGKASFARLFEAALAGLGPSEHLLDVGTGCGIWALLAARIGARVTATDLPHVDLSSIAESARQNDLPPPRTLHGDLFSSVAGERFDRIVFNPPFHFGAPADEAERAYLGGPGGEVVRGYLRGLSEHLEEAGRAYVILPRIEREGYESDLAAHHVREVDGLWLPVLGQVHLLELTPRERRRSAP